MAEKDIINKTSENALFIFTYISISPRKSILLYAPHTMDVLYSNTIIVYTGELGSDILNGTRRTGPSYAKSVVYI